VYVSFGEELGAIDYHNNSSVLRLPQSVAKAPHPIGSVRKAHQIDPGWDVRQRIVCVKVSPKQPAIEPLDPNHHALILFAVR
jgi:hypothetical protein